MANKQRLIELLIKANNLPTLDREADFLIANDVVPVVKCKNCDWYREHEGGICVNPKCGKSWYGCPVPPEHFCSYGERREGE